MPWIRIRQFWCGLGYVYLFLRATGSGLSHYCRCKSRSRFSKWCKSGSETLFNSQQTCQHRKIQPDQDPADFITSFTLDSVTYRTVKRITHWRIQIKINFYFLSLHFLLLSKLINIKLSIYNYRILDLYTTGAIDIHGYWDDISRNEQYVKLT